MSHFSRHFSVAAAVLTVLIYSMATNVAHAQLDSNSMSRYLAWKLGYSMGMAAAVYNRAGSVTEVDRALQSAERVAELLQVDVPPLPPRTGEEVRDASEIFDYITSDARPIGERLASNYPSDHVALFELGLKSWLIWIFTLDDKTREIHVELVQSRASAAGLPYRLWGPLVEKLEANASAAEVERAHNRMLRDISEFLKLRASTRP